MKQKHFIFALVAMLSSFSMTTYAEGNVAKVGDTEYSTLAAAISEATAGGTVVLIDDVKENVSIGKSLTIDGAGKQYTGTMTGNAGLTITVQNVNFVNGGFDKSAKSSTGTYTIKSCTFEDNGSYAYPLRFKGANKITVEDCTVKNYLYSFLYVTSGTNTVNVKNVTVEDCPNYAVYFASGVNSATFEGLTVKNADNGFVINNTANRSFTIKDCTMENVGTAIAEANGTKTITVTALGVNDFGTATLSDYAVIKADAVVGTKVYETLADAVAAAQGGETVALRRNVQLDNFVTIDKSITLDLGNYNVTRDGGTALYVNGTDINVTINGENGLVTGYQALFVRNGAVKVNGGKFHGTSKNSEAVYVIDNGKVEIYGGTFSGSGESNFVLNEYDATREATDITVYGGTFVGFNPANNAAEGVGTSFVADNYVVADNGDGLYSVADPAYGKVAKIGDNYFAKLSEAITAATAGQTITLIADITENVTISKNVNIDGAGKTFKGAIELNATKGVYSIKNVNFDGSNNTNKYAVKVNSSTNSITVENCTAKYGFGFLHLNKQTTNATVKNITVEEVSYGVHSVYGTNLTLENYTATNTNYAVMVQNYGVRNVTLKNCSLTDCENPLVIWERNQTNKITFNFEGVNEMGKSEFCTSAMAVINADAVVGTKVYETLADAVAAAQEGEIVALRRNVQLDNFVTIDKSITLDLGNYNVTRDGGTALYVNGTDINVTINGENGQVTGYQALFVKNGAVKVNGGKFHGTSKNSEAVYVINNGKVEIYGGTFSGSGESNFVLNEYDATRDATDITVYGGTFVGFNPADNAAEGAGTNFVADNYVVADNGDGSYSVAVDPAYGKVAKIDDDYYETLAEAVEAAEAGATVTMISDATGAGVVINKNIIIDFDGKTYTFNKGVGSSANTESNGFQILKGNNVTLKNGTLNVADEAKETFYTIIQNYANLTVENMNLDGTNLDKWATTDGDSYVLSINCGNVLVTGNTNITANNDGDKAFAFDACDKTAYGYALPVVTVETTGTIAGKIESTATIAITSGTYTVDVTEWCAEGYMAQQNEDGNYAVVVDPAYGKVAKIGDNYFAKLSEAITAATAGQTITLLADINENVTISKSVTIDGAGFKYTGTMTGNAGQTITVQNVNFVNGGFAKTTKSSTGVYTFKDCTFEDNATIAYPLQIRGAKTLNVENCTAKGYIYSFLRLYSGAVDVSIKNVTVEDCPSYAINFASGVTNGATIEGLTVKNSNNGFVIDNTSVRNLTIKDCSMENVTTAINHADGAKAINCTALGLNNFGTAAMSEYVKFNAEAQAGAVVGELAGVVNAAQNDETVTLLRDITLTNDNVITTKDGYNVMVNVDGKNITLDMNGKKILVDNYSKDGYLLAVLYVADGAGLTVTGNGSIDIPQTDRKVAYMFWKRGTTGYLVVENGNFHAGNLEDSMIYTNGDEIVTVNGGTFVIDRIAERSNGCPWIFNAQGTNANSINVLGGTYNFNVSKQHYRDEAKLGTNLAMANNGDGTWTVVPAIAAIDDECYATLAEAIEAAKADDIVTLVADTAAAGVVINKDVTIDFNGKTYTVNKAVGSAGTETLGFQILKDNDVTLKNGTLTSTAVTEGNQVKMLIQNYANLTLEDMNLVDETDHILYVLSNNCGDTELIGETNITTDAVAFDSYKYGSYAAPTVTVNTTGKIEGAIEKNDGATIAITSGTFTTPILPEWCAEYYVPVTNEDGTYGVVYTYVDEKTIDDDKYYRGEMPAEGFVNKNEQTVGTLTYKRTFSEVNLWQALYVPFEIPVETLTEMGYEVAYLYDVHNVVVAGEEIDPANIESIHFVRITKGTLRGNYPYIIRPTTNAALKLELTLNDAKLYSTDAKNSVESSTTTTRYIFTGTYADAYSTDITGSDDIPCFRINSSGKWQKMGETAILVPFRICMYIVNKDGSPVIVSDEAAKSIQIRIIGEENEDGTTTIYDVEADEQTVDYIYDLQGRRVLEPQKGGLYIVNGKKVVIK